MISETRGQTSHHHCPSRCLMTRESAEKDKIFPKAPKEERIKVSELKTKTVLSTTHVFMQSEPPGMLAKHGVFLGPLSQRLNQ